MKNGKWWLNRNTPPGDEAEIWERMSHGGRRQIYFEDIIVIERKTP